VVEYQKNLVEVLQPQQEHKKEPLPSRAESMEAEIVETNSQQPIEKPTAIVKPERKTHYKVFHYPKPFEAGFQPQEWNYDSKTKAAEKIEICIQRTKYRQQRKKRTTFFLDQDQDRQTNNTALDWEHNTPIEEENQLEMALKANGIKDLHQITDWTDEERYSLPKKESPPPLPNVLMWNGCRKYIPEWATQPRSARQIRKTGPLSVPKHLLHRLKVGPTYRRIPMDGINRYEDLLMRYVQMEGKDFILLQATTRQIEDSLSVMDKRSLIIPFKVMPQLLHNMDITASAVLQKASSDIYIEDPKLYQDHISTSDFDYYTEVMITCGNQGDERLVRLYKQDKQLQLKGSIAFPWLYTTPFVAHLHILYTTGCKQK
jgi:hypothetical protein